ncbi:MAG: hypothetical protein OXN84_01860 [Albidovulum sp.]|nr:hypothetical protein [Albidovulum sp.]
MRYVSLESEFHSLEAAPHGAGDNWLERTSCRSASRTPLSEIAEFRGEIKPDRREDTRGVRQGGQQSSGLAAGTAFGAGG